MNGNEKSPPMYLASSHREVIATGESLYRLGEFPGIYTEYRRGINVG